MSRFFSFLLGALCLPAFLGCGPQMPSASIIFPADGSVFPSDALINLMADADVSWESDLDGMLAQGARVLVSLRPGRHRIRIRDGAGREADAISLTLRAVEFSAGSSILIYPNAAGIVRSLPGGTYLPMAVSWSEENLHWWLGTTSKALVLPMPWLSAPVPPRQGMLTLPPGLLDARAAKGSDRNIKTSKSGNTGLCKIGDVRSWRMADPSKGTMEPGFRLEARLVGIHGDIELWIDTEDAPDEDSVEEFLRLGPALSLPRAMSLWGRGPEPDGDGRIAVLMSGRLNDGGLAIGFFNPCDFFPFADDPLSPDYNPTSNGRDALYLGVPVLHDPWFSPASLAATLAHEYQHLTRFGLKTWAQLAAGQKSADQEDLPFDEGMAHLTESLVGLGCSGGNALFALRYLDDPGAYSLRGRDADGELDSAGKRGICALFLSWMIEKAGGLKWTAADPLVPEAGQALSLLRSSLVPGRTGWDAISVASGLSMETLFRDFCSALNGGGRAAGPPPIDPLTGEPTRLSAFMGDFSFGGRSYRLSGPHRGAGTPEGCIIPWSCRFFSPWSIDSPVRQTFLASPDPGASLMLEMLMVDG